MARLHDLLHSLATVLILYHDTQEVKPLISEADPVILVQKTREKAEAILHEHDVPYHKCINELIKECPDRKPFLSYLLNEIIYVKTMLDQEEPFSHREFEEYKTQISRMFTDFRQLLSTDKTKTCGVNYSAKVDDDCKVISIAGLMNTTYIGKSLCKSGELLTREVMLRFNISNNAKDKEIGALVEDLCLEHLNVLLIQDLKIKKAALEKENAHQKATLDVQKIELSKIEKKGKDQDATIESLTHRLATAESDANDYRTSLQQLQARFASAESNHQKTLKQLQSQLSGAKSTHGDQEAELKTLQAKLDNVTGKVKEQDKVIVTQRQAIANLERQKESLLSKKEESLSRGSKPMGLVYAPFFNNKRPEDREYTSGGAKAPTLSHSSDKSRK